MTSIADIRTDYARASLDIADVDASPLRQFRRWFDEALKAEVAEVNAMNASSDSPGACATARSTCEPASPAAATASAPCSHWRRVRPAGGSGEWERGAISTSC